MTTDTNKKVRDYHKEKLSRFYGLTVDDYEAMLKFQNNACWLCGKPCSTGRRLAIDHDHLTGLIRGLLCSNCNRRIMGNLTDEQVKNMFDYISLPPAIQALGGRRYVPQGKERPKRKRRRRTVKRVSTKALWS